MITVFGSIGLDLIGTVPRLPGPGETVLGGTFATAPGNKGPTRRWPQSVPVRPSGTTGRSDATPMARRRSCCSRLMESI